MPSEILASMGLVGSLKEYVFFGGEVGRCMVGGEDPCCLSKSRNKPQKVKLGLFGNRGALSEVQNIAGP